MSEILPFQFLSDPGVKRLFAAFPDGSIRIVGGAVRNALLGAPVADIDLATQLEPDAVIDTLKAADIKYVPTGIDHGTITAVIAGQPYEITSLRRDVATDGRRAVVAYSTDWAEDAQRRDFTMNALYMDADGTLFDPTGQGEADSKARKLRFVGEADARVKEDYLRILRFFRFMAYYSGEAKVDAEALKACRENQAGLNSLSAERVWAELKRLLSAPNPTRAVTVMHQQGILTTLLSEADNSDGLAAMVRLEAREALSPDPLRRLMAMGARLPLPVLTLSRRLKLSKAETARLKGWAESEAPIDTLIDPITPDRERLAWIYREGKAVIMDRAILRAAGETDAMKSAYFMSLADLAMGWTPPVFPLTGKDLKKAGFAPGEGMGRMLKALEALWVRSGFTTEKAQLLVAAKMIGGG
jgi:tRNA nucleotidyltransferase/poly(A) polymerase